jgi:hypothetical protein
VAQATERPSSHRSMISTATSTFALRVGGEDPASCRLRQTGPPPSAASVISAGNGQLSPALASRSMSAGPSTVQHRRGGQSRVEPDPGLLNRARRALGASASLSAGIRSPVQKPKRSQTLIGPAKAPSNRATSSRNPTQALRFGSRK